MTGNPLKSLDDYIRFIPIIIREAEHLEG